jgi:hypothetical protein
MVDFKEANRIFYAVKGHLIPDEYSQYDIDKMYESYTKRLWGNHEASIGDDDFEALWDKVYNEPPEWPDFVESDFI